MIFTDRDITKTELDAIYADFTKIEVQDGVPQVERVRFNYVVEEDGQVIGFVSGLTHFRTWFVLTDLWVHEDHRRRGLGSELLRKMEERVKSDGRKHIYLLTSGFINPLFYEKHGYHRFSVLEDYHEVKGYHQIGYRKDFDDEHTIGY